MDFTALALEGSASMSSTKSCKIGSVEFGTGALSVIAGPCMAESLEICMEVAGQMTEICKELDIGYVFKASFDKANRSSVESYRGPGIEEGLGWLKTVRSEFNVPVLTDIHLPEQAQMVGMVVDCLQIPAFLARQTDLLVAAGNTGKPVNVKKGQFMSPDDMENAVEKIRSCDNNNILLTERGTFFGYNRLVSDMRSMRSMQKFAPVVFDATHSVQQPGGLGKASGGQREFVLPLGLAAIAAGADALFIETHPQPEKALSDAACQMPLDEMKPMLKKSLGVFRAVRSL
jgi:2-dehydro-3-deoxyphosphooctonate aldolase (KDO 8-P synthase)